MEFWQEFWRGDANLAISGYILRALVAYLFLFGIIKFLGQRTMSNLQAQDFLFAIVIGDVVGGPLVNGNESLAGPFTVALSLTAIHYGLTLLILKSVRIRRFVDEEPIILVSHGKILRNMMKKSKVTLDMLLMSARMKNVTRMSDVQLAILEPNGEISIITKAEVNPLTPADLAIPPANKVSMPSVFIEDGHIQKNNLQFHSRNEEWLFEQLRSQGIEDPNEVFLALLEPDGNLYVATKSEPYIQR